VKIPRAAAGALVGAIVGAAAIAGAAPWGKSAGKHTRAPTEREKLIAEGDSDLTKARRNLRILGVNGSSQYLIDATLESESYARRGLEAYWKAAAIQDDAELHYRAFIGIAQFFQDTTADRWTLELEEFDALRKADPNDPRETTILPEVCTALSKLGGDGGAGSDDYFSRGVKEFHLWRSRIDTTNPDFAKGLAIATVNAAELEMALGPDHIEDSIADYQSGTDLDPTESLGWYGLAVAADRDGQWTRARAAMKEAVDRDYDPDTGKRLARLTSRGVYFVPAGDVHYYQALRAQIMGDKTLALEEYEKFLGEAKATRYAARAKQHIADLKADKTKGTKTVVEPTTIEPPR
jgi:tetratricopeptide (TPR) repeat protein